MSLWEDGDADVVTHNYKDACAAARGTEEVMHGLICSFVQQSSCKQNGVKRRFMPKVAVHTVACSTSAECLRGTGTALCLQGVDISRVALGFQNQSSGGATHLSQPDPVLFNFRSASDVVIGPDGGGSLQSEEHEASVVPGADCSRLRPDPIPDRLLRADP